MCSHDSCLPRTISNRLFMHLCIGINVIVNLSLHNDDILFKLKNVYFLYHIRDHTDILSHERNFLHYSPANLKFLKYL